MTSLSRFKKQKARAEKRRQGDENAARYGQSKAEKAAARQDTARQTAFLDGHRRSPPEDPA